MDTWPACILDIYMLRLLQWKSGWPYHHQYKLPCSVDNLDKPPSICVYHKEGAILNKAAGAKSHIWSILSGKPVTIGALSKPCHHHLTLAFNFFSIPIQNLISFQNSQNPSKLDLQPSISKFQNPSAATTKYLIELIPTVRLYNEMKPQKCSLRKIQNVFELLKLN